MFLGVHNFIIAFKTDIFHQRSRKKKIMKNEKVKMTSFHYSEFKQEIKTDVHSD